MSYRVTTAIVAILAIGAILWLIRKDHLHPRKAVFWVLACVAIGLLGFFPAIADWVAAQLGIDYSPTLVLTLGIVILLIKLLRLDIARTQEHQMLVILSQRIAIMEKQLDNERISGQPRKGDERGHGSTRAIPSHPADGE